MTSFKSDITGRQGRLRIDRRVGALAGMLELGRYPIPTWDVAPAPALRPATFSRLARRSWALWSAHHETVAASLTTLVTGWAGGRLTASLSSR